MKKITKIIEATLEWGSRYFSEENLRFFNQKPSDFKVKYIGNERYIVTAPSYWDGRLMGYSSCIVDFKHKEVINLNN